MKRWALAIVCGGVGPGATCLIAEVAAGLGEGSRAIAGAVVGHDTIDAYTEGLEVGDGPLQAEEWSSMATWRNSLAGRCHSGAYLHGEGRCRRKPFSHLRPVFLVNWMPGTSPGMTNEKLVGDATLSWDSLEAHLPPGSAGSPTRACPVRPPRPTPRHTAQAFSSAPPLPPRPRRKWRRPNASVLLQLKRSQATR
jgi:hypothetical protein